MNSLWKLSKIAEVVDGELIGVDVPVSNVNFDTRELKSHGLFVPLRGSNYDGHEFINNAYKLNCSILLREDKKSLIKSLKNINAVIVKDVREALSKLASYKISTTHALKIAITGSSGKTTVRDMVRLILSNQNNNKYIVHSSIKSYNNSLGVDYTLANMPEGADYLITELGTNSVGEIIELTNKIKPNIGLLVNIGTAHIGRFKSQEALIKEKLSLFNALEVNGIAVLCRDNEYYSQSLEYIKSLGVNNVYSFGFHEKSDCKVISYNPSNKNKPSNRANIEILIKGEKINMLLPIGKSYALSAAAALLCSSLAINKGFLNSIDDNMVDFSCLSQWNPFQGRGNIEVIKNYGDSKCILINDCYNANYVSIINGLEMMQERYVADKKMIIVLGGMKELGVFSNRLHKKVLDYLLEKKINKKMIIYLFGKEFKKVYLDYEKLLSNIIYYDQKRDLLDILRSHISAKTEFYLKGSKDTKLDFFIKGLKQ